MAGPPPSFGSGRFHHILDTAAYPFPLLPAPSHHVHEPPLLMPGGEQGGVLLGSSPGSTLFGPSSSFRPRSLGSFLNSQFVAQDHRLLSTGPIGHEVNAAEEKGEVAMAAGAAVAPPLPPALLAALHGPAISATMAGAAAPARTETPQPQQQQQIDEEGPRALAEGGEGDAADAGSSSTSNSQPAAEPLQTPRSLVRLLPPAPPAFGLHPTQPILESAPFTALQQSPSSSSSSSMPTPAPAPSPTGPAAGSFANAPASALTQVGRSACHARHGGRRKGVHLSHMH